MSTVNGNICDRNHADLRGGVMIEITVFECESCSSRFDTEKEIHECTECGCEICDVCQAEDDLCDDCSDKMDAIYAAMHDTREEGE